MEAARPNLNECSRMEAIKSRNISLGKKAINPHMGKGSGEDVESE